MSQDERPVLTEDGITYHGRAARVMLLLLGIPITVIGVATLLGLAATSRRLPDPPRIIDQLLPFVDLAALSGGSYSLSMVLFLLFLGMIALLVGGVLLIKALSPDPSLTISKRESKMTREPSNSGSAIVVIAFYLLLGAWGIISSTPATIDRPWSIVRGGNEIYSSNPQILLIYVGFGVVIVIMFLFSETRRKP